jgi:hypothetical protein
MSLSIEELAAQYHQAWTDLDVDAIVALHTEDSVFHLHGVTDAATGRSAIRQTIVALLGLVPDLHFDAKRAYWERTTWCWSTTCPVPPVGRPSSVTAPT